MRIFFGIPLNDILTQTFAISLEHAEDLSSQFKFLKQENLHLTLQFIGEVPAEKIPPLIELAQQALINKMPFSVPTIKIDLFPPNHSRMIAVYVALEKPLATLYNALNEALTKAGHKLEARPYCPHITLARNKTKKNFHMSPIPLETQIPINEVILFESVAGKEGSDYKPLHRFNG